MDTAFVIGNGESRPIFPIQDLKGKGIIYGCNGIYRDNPELCDHIVAVNQPMYEELKAWHEQTHPSLDGPILGTEAINDFSKNKVKKNFYFINNLKPIINSHYKNKNHINLIVSKSGNSLLRRGKGSWATDVNIRFPREEWEERKVKIHGPEDISRWNYICDGDKDYDTPKNLKLYRYWRGGDIKKGNAIRTIDFSLNRGSGMSAVLMAAESGIKNVVILAFDILGSRQWERDTPSRSQNNMYKNTINYPSRISMKAYLKYEWMYQLRQIIRKHPNTNFHFINRKEYIWGNTFLRWYFDQPNIGTGTYADLRRYVDGQRDDIKWMKL